MVKKKEGMSKEGIFVTVIVAIAFVLVATNYSENFDNSPRGITGNQIFEGSCVGFCGSTPNYACYCDDTCISYGDCCGDYESVCLGVSSGPNLIGHYKFNSGLFVLQDSSGLSNHGKARSGLDCAGDSGIEGNGCTFGVPNQGVDIQSINDNVDSKKGTMMAWVYPTATGSNRYIVQGVGSNSNRFYLQYHNGQVRAVRGNPAVTVTLGNVPLNQWSHVVMTWTTETSGQGTVKGYLNGNLIGEKTFTNSGSAAWFFIGDQPHNTDNKEFLGSIDEVRFYDGALSTEEVKGIYDDGIKKKVLVLNFDPIIERLNNRRFSEIYGYYDYEELTKEIIKDFYEASDGNANYEVVDTIYVDSFPPMFKGFIYTDETYSSCLIDGVCYEPNAADYNKILGDYEVCEKLNSGEIDELWMWSGPLGGFDESAMAGPKAFHINGGTYRSGNICERMLPIMGFNYEREAGLALHSYGHRIEGTLTYVFQDWDPSQSRHDWDRFAHNFGQTRNVEFYGCGSVHYPHNAIIDYQTDSEAMILSNCNDWLNYPDFHGTIESINCDEWGCNEHGYQKWWMDHIPTAEGETNHISNNWWSYVVDPQKARQSRIDRGIFTL